MRKTLEPKGETISRRSFLDRVLGFGIFAWLISVLYPLLRYIIPPKIAEPRMVKVEAGPVDLLKPNSGKIVRFGSEPVILIRTPEGEYRAFSATCARLSYRCACHNGHYDLSGRNIAGPPPRPLEPYKVVLKDKKIIIIKGSNM